MASILAHISSYIKNYNYLLRSLTKNNTITISNINNILFDTVASKKYDTIFLPMEDYSLEFHTLIHDHSYSSLKIYLCVNDNKINDDNVCKILQSIKSNIFCILPQRISCELRSNITPIWYNNLINSDIIYNKSKIKNNKLLCILSQDKDKVKIIKPYLYPNTFLPIVLINNPEIQYEQNIGLCFDEDMNEMLNVCGSVIDLSETYDAELSVLGVKKYNINSLDQSFKDGPETIKLNQVDDADNIVSKLLL